MTDFRFGTTLYTDLTTLIIQAAIACVPPGSQPPPIISVLEGGYNLEATAESALEHVKLLYDAFNREQWKLKETNLFLKEDSRGTSEKLQETADDEDDESISETSSEEEEDKKQISKQETVAVEEIQRDIEGAVVHVTQESNRTPHDQIPEGELVNDISIDELTEVLPSVTPKQLKPTIIHIDVDEEEEDEKSLVSYEASEESIETTKPVIATTVTSVVTPEIDEVSSEITSQEDVNQSNASNGSPVETIHNEIAKLQTIITSYQQSADYLDVS